MAKEKSNKSLTKKAKPKEDVKVEKKNKSSDKKLLFILKKPIKKETPKEVPFEERSNLKKMYLHITIVDNGIARNVVDLLTSCGTSMYFVQRGEGTASKQIKSVLNLMDISKEVVFSFFRESQLENLDKELGAFFASSERNKGIAFAIPLTSLLGVRIYKMLSKTL